MRWPAAALGPEGDLAAALHGLVLAAPGGSWGGGLPGPGTARLLYGAVLRALPASARTWFGDLRDRGTAAAVEAYTAAVESPALLAAEMAHIQVWKGGGVTCRCGMGGEQGGRGSGGPVAAGHWPLKKRGDTCSGRPSSASYMPVTQPQVPKCRCLVFFKP